jgi:Fe-S-cluster containining protein
MRRIFLCTTCGTLCYTDDGDDPLICPVSDEDGIMCSGFVREITDEVNLIVTEDNKIWDRYQMCKDQLAQIDCRMIDCIFYKSSGRCSNISPAITLNENNTFMCWTYKNKT